jgi:hemolysin III
VSHLVAFFIALVAGPVLVAHAGSTRAGLVASIYAASLAAMFGCSALLHRGHWSDQARPWLRRLDHSMIFVFIAGTYTPLCALSLSSGSANLLLGAVWTGAAVGVLITLLWIDAPRWITAACYVTIGWLAVFAAPDLASALAPGHLTLLVTGGMLYTVGAVFYARKRPDPFPTFFGYHELFHALVIAAVVCHFTVIAASVVR